MRKGWLQPTITEYSNIVKKKIDVMMSDKKHKSGTDRVAEISKKFNYKWILNIQGDEPSYKY